MWNFRQMGTRSSYLCGNTLQTSSPTSQFYNGFDNSAYWRSSHFQMRRGIQSERRWWYWMSLLGFLVLVASQLYWGRLRTTFRNWERQSLLDKSNHKHWQHRRIPLLSRYERLLLLHTVKASGRKKTRLKMLFRSKTAIQTELVMQWLEFEFSQFNFCHITQLQNTNNLSSDYIAEKWQQSSAMNLRPNWQLKANIAGKVTFRTKIAKLDRGQNFLACGICLCCRLSSL